MVGPHNVLHSIIRRQMSRLETFYGAKPLFCQFEEKLVWLDFSAHKSRVVSTSASIVLTKDQEFSNKIYSTFFWLGS